MFEDISIKREYTAFHGYAWKTWNTNESRVNITVSDGAGGHAGQDLTIQQAQELVQMLNDLIAKAEAIPDHSNEEDESPF